VATCLSCGTEAGASASVCPRCLAPLPFGDDATRLAEGEPDETRLSTSSAEGRPPSSRSGAVRHPTSSSGWLSSSGAIDHGRFEPGTLLGGRYRIVGRLGKGGMGEVFRADDLKLGQPVALKFLPPDVDRDPARLTQLHTEVRMARQVSHPNVCRVYDIDEVDGHTFLSMEYVDGEDLASLLRRIGRFPEDRALAIARQICAGLAAAHERGVVHRDFKPANVMLDGSGKVRITDFGLAGLAGEAIRAGTPAYMAPEQLAGAEVTARSDIYALGLVLYEIFTGQRALDAKNLAELIRRREQSEIVLPTAIVRDLDPQIERAILRCLAPSPDDRPASALAAAAMLPGGDPLAAALAAGETPSPEMVAAAGGAEFVSARTAWMTAGWIALSLVAIMGLYQRVMLVNRVPTPKPPAALEDRASEALAALGYTDPPAATASGLGFSDDYANYIESTDASADRWSRLGAERPEALYLWYRTSPEPLIPSGRLNPVSGLEPPLNIGGMTLLLVDASGRLAEFIAVPPPFERDQSEARETDWGVLFELAGLPMASFTPARPVMRPTTFADERRAWEGRLPELPDHPIRIEAAAVDGRPVYFGITGPWTRSAREPEGDPPLFNAITAALTALIVPGLMLAGALLARRNVKLGRGERRGAFRAAAFVFLLAMTAWLLRQHVMPLSAEVDRMFAAMGLALFDAGMLWLMYLGLEPYIRRHSPDSLIGWTRLVAGRWRDPRVGTDIMIGVSAGIAMTLFYALHNVVPPLFGRPEPMPLEMADANLLRGTRDVLAFLLGRIVAGVHGGMLCVVGFTALRMWIGRTWIAAAAAIACFTPVAIDGMFPEGTPILDLVMGAGLITVFVLTSIRFGLLATAAALTTHFILLRAPITIDTGAWRAPVGYWFLAVIAVAGLGAVYVARNGKQEPGVRM
jgi:tRNA A-37 threonylcarbamoyl transferase component Bud32